MSDSAGTHGHARADQRNLHLHRVAIEKLRRRPELKTPVLELLKRWLADDALACSLRWLEEWQELLTSSTIDELTERVLDEQGGQALRQCSPLGPVLTPQERWAALEEVNRIHASEAREAQ